LLLPGEESPQAAEGTLAHDTFYTALGLRNPYKVNFRTPQEKEYLPYSIEYVLNLKNLHPKVKIYREKRVNPAPYVGTRHCKGTADVIIPVPGGPLYVIDLKFGEHVVVDVIDNLQLLLYGIGAYAEFEDYRFTEIVLVISQPRAYHPDGINREWRLTPQELLRHARRLKRAAKRALTPRLAEFNPNPEEQCRFCPGQGVCRALADYELALARDVFTSIINEEPTYSEPSKLTPEELSALLFEFPGMRRWMTEVSGAALRHLQQGGKIPKWGLKEKLGNRKWSAEAEELELYFDEAILYEQTLRSPAQVEKLVGKGAIEPLTTREVTGQTIVETEETEASEPPLPFTVIDDAT
jgi:hypothetical protein